MRYARSGDASLAYQVLGEGGPDLLFVPGFASHLDLAWEEGIEVMNPTLAGDERFRTWFARNARAAASPAQARELFELCAATDLRDRLPAITAPTLVVQRVDDPWLSIEHSRWVAPRIPGARLVELGGVDHWPWIGDADAVLIEVQAFLTGHRRSRRDRPVLGPEALTRRERQACGLAVQGLTAVAIGQRLGIGERTAESHLANGYAKLGINSRLELVRRAGEFGL